MSDRPNRSAKAQVIPIRQYAVAPEAVNNTTVSLADCRREMRDWVLAWYDFTGQAPMHICDRDGYETVLARPELFTRETVLVESKARFFKDWSLVAAGGIPPSIIFADEKYRLIPERTLREMAQCSHPVVRRVSLQINGQTYSVIDQAAFPLAVRFRAEIGAPDFAALFTIAAPNWEELRDDA